MAWYSLLPANLIHVESWAVKVFVFLGFITIVPWLALIVFDMVLYICRLVAYEVPVVGGRARGMQRPRAPSLNEVPDRQRNFLGLDGAHDEVGEKDTNADLDSEGLGGLKRRSVYGGDSGE